MGYVNTCEDKGIHLPVFIILLYIYWHFIILLSMHGVHVCHTIMHIAQKQNAHKKVLKGDQILQFNFKYDHIL